jgi:hypothetical protein
MPMRFRPLAPVPSVVVETFDYIATRIGAVWLDADRLRDIDSELDHVDLDRDERAGLREQIRRQLADLAAADQLAHLTTGELVRRRIDGDDAPGLRLELRRRAGEPLPPTDTTTPESPAAATLRRVIDAACLDDPGLGELDGALEHAHGLPPHERDVLRARIRAYRALLADQAAPVAA